ncbi:MAG: N-acetylmuramoyl-L-alanine amidase [Deltaproteobacteria bacterium]|nr:N-acetylmuramoyl-L-alanine amidase [Deltaproteobacteria bacterium]
MSMSCKIIPFRRLLGLIIAILLGLSAAEMTAGAKTIYWGRTKKTVVLDPGHGGADSGAHSPDGTLEKRVALDLTRLIAAELAGQFRVELIRTDDYRLEIERRTDMANNLKADAFISVHAGGSFSPVPGGIIVFYYKKAASEHRPFPDRSPDTPGSWDRIQLKHVRTSHLLARHLKDRLDSVQPSEVLDAPALVLQGADMPAVLIEVGYLSNPEEAKALRDSRHLEDIARAVSGGIKAFFEDLRKEK